MKTFITIKLALMLFILGLEILTAGLAVFGAFYEGFLLIQPSGTTTNGVALMGLIGLAGISIGWAGITLKKMTQPNVRVLDE